MRQVVSYDLFLLVKAIRHGHRLRQTVFKKSLSDDGHEITGPAFRKWLRTKKKF